MLSRAPVRREAEPAEVEQRAAADVVDHRQTVLSARARPARPATPLGEAGNAVVARVDPHQRGGVRADGAFVVGQAGDVRGADLAEDGPADGHDFGDAEAAADLDELAAGDDHFLARGQGTQNDHRGGGVVVDRGGRLRPGQPANPFADGVLARRSLAGFQVHFQVEIAAGRFVSRAGRRLGHRRPAQVGVQDDAGGVDDRPQLRPQFPA